MGLIKPVFSDGPKILFVGGIHGVGKSTICAQVSAKLCVSHLIASDLIRAQKMGTLDIGKRVESVDRNQDVLVDALRSTLVPNRPYLSDGHFALLSPKEEIVDIPLSTFQAIGPVAISLIIDEPEGIAERLRGRDGQDYEVSLLTALQERERFNAEMVSSALGCPFLIINPLNGVEALEEFAAANLSRTNEI